MTLNISGHYVENLTVTHKAAHSQGRLEGTTFKKKSHAICMIVYMIHKAWEIPAKSELLK
jgi:hypothetical protein